MCHNLSGSVIVSSGVISHILHIRDLILFFSVRLRSQYYNYYK